MSCLAGDTTRQALQIQVAVDGLSVVTKTGGAAQTCIASMSGGGLTVEQLRWVFSAESLAEVATAKGVAASEITPNDDGDAVKEWSDLSSNSACISSQIDLAYPDGESGTYEYFLEAVLHEAPAGFATGQQSADDNVLVNELVQNGDSIGYFGYAYYVENQDTLSAVPVKNSAGDYVSPTSTSVQDGTYNPLSRPMFMNLHAADASLAKSAPFLEFGLFTQGGDALTESVGYVPLGPELDAEMEARISSDGIVCGPAGNIEIAGSSTVLPLAEAWAEDYNAACDGITVSVNGGGSGVPGAPAPTPRRGRLWTSVTCHGTGRRPKPLVMRTGSQCPVSPGIRRDRRPNSKWPSTVSPL